MKISKNYKQRIKGYKNHFLFFTVIFLCLFLISSLIWGQKSPFSWNVSAKSGVSCNGLSITRSTITLGQTVSLIGRVSNYGIIRYAKVNRIGDRLSTGTNQTTLAKGYWTIKTGFKPTKPGVYVFEVNAYDSSRCGQLCTAGRTLYRNTSLRGGGCDTSGHWASVGSCTSSGCIKWVTVKAPTGEWCTDTDGGWVVSVKGTCNASVSETVTDYCLTNTLLVEAVCEDTDAPNQVPSVEDYCAQGFHDCSLTGRICINGACVNDPCPCTTSLDCSNNWVERTTTCNGPECTNPTSSVQLIEDCSASGKICQNGACKLP